MTLFKHALLTVAAAFVLVVPSQAGTVTWNFTGTFASSNLGPSGTSLVGSLTFDTNAPRFIDDPNQIYFDATSLEFTVTGYPGDVTYSMSAPLMIVRNDFQSTDQVLVIAPISSISNPGNVSGLAWESAQFWLHDGSQNMLNSVNPPTTPPSLAGLTVKSVSLLQGKDSFTETYTLTSLTEAAAAVPEPASMGLIALGLAGVAVTAVRKRYTTR